MKQLGLVVLLGLAGCMHWVEVQTPMPELLESFPPPRLRLATASASFVMIGAGLLRDTLSGLIERESDGEKVAGALLGVSLTRFVPGTVAVQDVVRVEVRRRSIPATVGLVALGAAGVAVSAVLLVKALGSFRGIGLNTPPYDVTALPPGYRQP